MPLQNPQHVLVKISREVLDMVFQLLPILKWRSIKKQVLQGNKFQLSGHSIDGRSAFSSSLDQIHKISLQGYLRTGSPLSDFLRKLLSSGTIKFQPLINNS